MMFRDPRRVAQERVRMKIMQTEMRARARVRGAGVNAIAGAEKKVKGAASKDGGGAKAEKKKFKLWPFGSKDKGGGGAAEVAGSACFSCGKGTDPSWEMCPYCGTNLREAAPPTPAGQMPVPQGQAPELPQMTGNKTQAINLDELAGPSKMVVGWLVIMEGNEKGRDFRLYEGQNSIGAAADCAIVVNDEYLSAHHASIRFDNGRYELIDKDSTNGCFLNEKRVTREELVDNDTIRLGRTHLRFKAIY